ncbi:MAG: hypothetical protein IJ644_10215, partial [Oscillospiraceae bacterium]|nr:hypothetical protein [Oscillospiraceae bacterium]
MMEKIKNYPVLGQFLPVIASVVTGAGFCYFLDFQTSNVFSVIFLFLLCPLYRQALQIHYDKKLSFASVTCGILFMLFLWLRKMTFYCYAEYETQKLLKTIAMTIGFFLFFTALTAVLYDRIRNADLNTPPPVLTKKKKNLIFWGSVGLMFLCWFPYFLYLYPAEVTADSISELNQAEGNEALSNHHPLAHTFMIKIFFDLGNFLFHDENMALATYS